MAVKLNLGASPIWFDENWHILDHKLNENSHLKIAGDADSINLDDESCSFVFCSHVFEHIPHLKLPRVISEINRILRYDGIVRILTPDLEKVACAYANKDEEFFNKALSEDENIRTDLGFGGKLMNFIVSPGQDTVLLNRNLDTFISGYAHLYCYDYEMLKIIFEALGFECRKAKFCDSELEEVRTPLHVVGVNDGRWESMNKEFYERNGLTHQMVDGRYNINFKVTGFDRDPVTSLIVEAKKKSCVSAAVADEIFNQSEDNYNRYAYSLLSDSDFRQKLRDKGIKQNVHDE